LRRLLAALCLLWPGVLLHAQDLEPRNYINLPVDQNFAGVGYAYSEGSLDAAPSVPLEDAELDVDSWVAAYARSLAIAGSSAKLDVVWGWQSVEGSAIFDGEFVEATREGYHDPRVRLGWNFFGAPAMGMAEFRSSEHSGLVIGGSLQVAVPIGSYNRDRLINSGANRWMVKPELGLSASAGRWDMDLAVSGRFFTDNDEFFGDVKLEQDPIYAVQAHLIYRLSRGRWLSLNGNYFWGGRTTKNGVRGDDLQKNSRVGVTLSWPLNAQHSLKFLANTGTATRVGNDFDTYSVAWQYRWGDD
jgi:hypothetical protein